MARTFWGPYKIVRGIHSSGHWGVIKMPGQEANSDNLGILFFEFLHNNCMYDEAALMGTHKVQFHDEIRNFP